MHADDGKRLASQISELNREIFALERRLKAKYPGGIPDPDAAGPAGNAAWQKLREEWGASNTAATGKANLWAEGPASHHLYGGRMNQQRRHEAVTVTQAALKKFSDAMKSMPSEADEESDPKALKSSVQLYPHQRQALAWLLWRETQDPPGGILADDMGLGKTLTMLSLILKHKELEADAAEESPEKENEKDEWISKNGKGLVRSKVRFLQLMG